MSVTSWQGEAGKRHRSRFTVHLLLVVVLVTAVVMAISLGFVWQQEKRRLLHSLQEDAVRSTNMLRAFMDRRLDRGHTFARAIAESRDLRRGLADGSALMVQRALMSLEREYESYHLIVYDVHGKAIGWTSALAIGSLGLKAPRQQAPGALPEARVLHGDLALVYERVLESDGESLGSFRLAILLGRLFVSQVSRDIERPVALRLGDRTVHSTFRGEPPFPVARDEEGGSYLVSTGDGLYEVAWAEGERLPGSETIWMAAGTPRAPLDAARKAFLKLTGLVALGGLVVVGGVVGVFTAYRWRRERRLIRQRDEAIGRSKGLSHRVADLTAIVHDIKAPVGGIQMLCEGLAEHEEDERRRGSLERVVDTCERLALFLVNVLTAAQAEEGPLQPRRETVLAEGLLDEVAERLEPIARRKKVRLETGGNGTRVGPFRADATLLERAMINLVANAIEVTEAGGTVRLAASSEGEAVTLAVEDEGPGFREFSPDSAFSRSRPRVKHDSIKAGSSGLGLYIVRRIAEAHGGTAVAENRDGRGARVWIRIPRDAA
jgi:signal transduction histidine kinase